MDHHVACKSRHRSIWTLPASTPINSLLKYYNIICALIDDKIVTLCFEFLTAGIDTTSTGLLWIMAELVPAVQDRLHVEIKTTCVSNAQAISEEAVQGMPYLKAVIWRACTSTRRATACCRTRPPLTGT
jgi:cytochrome P450